MPSRRSYRRGHSTDQQPVMGCLVLVIVGVVAGFAILSAILSAALDGLSVISQEIVQHPILSALALLVLGIAAGAISYGSFRLWQQSQQAKAAEAQRQYEMYLAHQRAQVAEAQRQYEAHLARISTLQGLQSLTPTQFERTVCDLVRSWGYLDVHHTGGAGDLAADLICRDARGFVTVVQCKRYATGNLIGSPELQKFIGMIYAHHRAHHGIFVTTSDFTEPALNLAHQHNIRTIDGNELVTLVQQWRLAIQHQQPRVTSG